MNKKFRAVSSKVAALPLAALVAVQSSAFAQSANGIESALDAVDFSGVVAKVGAAALVIISVALAFKGPAIAKRVIRGL